MDFNYEVSRSLAACEGALLVVDATQGVEAQTLANTYLAMDHDLEILPVFNKIDLPAADPLKAKQEVEDIIGLPALEAPEISAKLGTNIEAVLEDVVKNVPAPKGDPKAPCRRWCSTASTTPTWVWWCISVSSRAPCERADHPHDGHRRGVHHSGVRLPQAHRQRADGRLTGRRGGLFHRQHQKREDTQVGDTVTDAANSAAEALPGYRPAQSMVYCGIYTEDGSKYPDLRDALESCS